MSKSNKYIQLLSQEESEPNKTFCFSSPLESNEHNSKYFKSNGKKIFEIFHKKTEISIISLTDQNELKSKNTHFIQFKCFYCQNKYNNINIFEAHMRLHVS